MLPPLFNTNNSTGITLSSSLYITGCKDGKIRVMNGTTHELVTTLEGHTNAVTSLSWIESSSSSNNNNNMDVTNNEAAPWLVSGSWDGTARIWCLHTHTCVCILDGHENTVSVAGLPSDDDGGGGAVLRRRVVTTSAGIASGSSIQGHTVRIWQLKSSPTNVVTSELLAKVINDHTGPIRDVTYNAESKYIYIYM
jgi:WD40 repeat protein